MKNHARCPTICSSCRANVITMAQHAPNKVIVTFCEHESGDGQVAFLTVNQSAGAILRWMIDGPMTFEEAQRRAAWTAAMIPQDPRSSAPLTAQQTQA